MGTFSSLTARRGFASVYGPSSALDTRRSTYNPPERELENGTGSYQCDLQYIASRSLNGSSNEDLDLAGSLADAFGTTLTFVKVKGIWLFNPESNPAAFRLKPAASNGFLGPFVDASDILSINPGACVHLENLASGWAVTAGTGDKLNVANQHTSAQSYYIHIIGTSA